MKYWLIRTYNKQILGPLTKTRVLEFVKNGSLGPDDEIMSGNGYWFAIKESELLDKYLYGEVPQSFNPISEAMSVLTGNFDSDETTSYNQVPFKKKNEVAVSDEVDEQQKLPSEEDLEYPDLEDEIVDSVTNNTVVFQMPMISKESSKKPAEKDKDEHFEVGLAKSKVIIKDNVEKKRPVVKVEKITKRNQTREGGKRSGNSDISAKESEKIVREYYDEEVETKKTKKNIDSIKKKVKEGRGDLYLLYIVMLLLALIVGVFFYYKKILNKPIPVIGGGFSLISDSYAQIGDVSLGKKKVQFHSHH